MPGDCRACSTWVKLRGSIEYHGFSDTVVAKLQEYCLDDAASRSNSYLATSAALNPGILPARLCKFMELELSLKRTEALEQ